MYHLETGKAVRIFGWIVFVTFLLVGTDRRSRADAPSVGIDTRIPWTTSRIAGSPDPPPPYVTERAFSGLKFSQCLDITSAPGSDRLFVVEQSGKLLSFPNIPDVKTADLVVDFAKEIDGLKAVYALAFHPNFERNRYCYICYIKAANLPDGTHVARFQMSDANPPTIDVSSETTLITWLSGGHNGCCLKFGPDGCLYISTGDGGPANPPDPLHSGQDISNLLSSILRIDVDHHEDGMNYGIPGDNPFVDTDGARGEVWAYGLRNPWRMSFDQQTGDLWVGDVGWELWEMLYRIERGGNYGWAVTEGHHPTNQEWSRGPTPILPPTIDHPHSESSSITGGLTYYGSRLEELRGTHIYGDYDTGKFWGFRYENGQVVDHRELADTTHRVVGFGDDHQGEFFILDHTAGTIHRLVPNPSKDQSSTFPRKLSETGLFASITEQKPAPGVLPYSINAQPWADHSVAERFVGVPNELSIQANGATWSFPKDSVLAKTLSLDMEHGNSTTRRRVETQVLHFDGVEWQPYTYQWNEEQSDAVLVGAAGTERTFEVVDPNSIDGVRKQVWRFSGRAECQRCHNKWSGPPLAFNTPQLNREHNYGDLTASQLDTFAHIRLIEKPVAAENRPRLADPSDSSAELDGRARAYLQVNCAHCHRQHAGGAVLSKMHYDVALGETNMVDVRPTQGTFGIHTAQVIAPGDPFRSVLLYRMAKLGGGRMPHIGSSEVDLAGVELIESWIRNMPLNKEATRNLTISTRRVEAAVALEQLVEKQASDHAKLVERLLSTTSGALMLLKSVDQNALPDSVVSLTVQQAAQHSDVSIRDLFERFLPPGERVQRLGSLVRPDQILSLEGDLARGKRVFFNTAGVSCKNCHRVQKEGKEVGPDLTKIGEKQKRADLLESILEPSKRIDPKFVTYLVETKDGRVLTGLLVSKDEKEVVLRDATNMLVQIPAADVEQLATQQKSLMPDLLFREMTAQQVADLVAYLSALK
ncbi:MAG: PQQ-dependent sugar dehydrogenase [Planctomycetes bacterium]|nr:PQQ-dependent sugar dehydrogenase [Planctomycetota bacterium]